MAKASVGDYFWKREMMNRLSAELEALEESEAIKQKIDLEFDLKHMLSRYELTPRELIEAVIALYPSDFEQKAPGHSRNKDEDAPRFNAVTPGVDGSPVSEENRSAAVQTTSRPEGPVTRRRLKKYTNPQTGEIVLTRGANHRTLNLWRQKHGQTAVDQWWEYVDAADNNEP